MRTASMHHDRLRHTLAAAVLGVAFAAYATPVGGIESQPALVLASEDDAHDLGLGDFLAGHVAFVRAELDAADSHFARAFARNPGNQDLLSQVFILALARGDFETALGHAEAVREAEPTADEAHLIVALSAVNRRDFGAARDELARLGPNGIASLALPFLDAWAIYGPAGRDALAEARERLEAAEALGPLKRYHEAMLLLLAGESVAAIDELAEAMPEEGHPPDRLVRAYAAALVADGQVDEAERFLEGQLDNGRDLVGIEAGLEMLRDRGMFPAPFEDAGGGMADALLGIGQALQQERGGVQAILYARLATFLEPDLGEAALLIGDVLAEEGNYPEAIDAYREVPPDSPLAETAGLRVARALHIEERQEEAYALLEELADAEPDHTDALVQLGDLLRRDEAYLRAEQAYSRAIARIGPPQPDHWTLYYARGITFERTKRWAEAEDDFLLALELQPEQPFVLNYLGYSWVDMGLNLDEAKSMLVRAVELRPEDGFIVDSLGWVHYRLGAYEDAVETLERAVELEPGDPVINDHLGDAYWRVGREREARYQWERALTLDPEEDEIPLIEQKLEHGLPDDADGERI